MSAEKPERGWRVTAPSGLVLPPWDLCGFDRDFDPYGESWFGPAAWAGYLVEPERAIADPNEADGRWGEFAFMPHVSAPWLDFQKKGEPASVEVPAYLTVGEALAAEQLMRYERAERRLVARIERAQERWSRLWRFVYENASEAE